MIFKKTLPKSLQQSYPIKLELQKCDLRLYTYSKQILIFPQIQFFQNILKSLDINIIQTKIDYDSIHSGTLPILAIGTHHFQKSRLLEFALNFVQASDQQKSICFQLSKIIHQSQYTPKIQRNPYWFLGNPLLKVFNFMKTLRIKDRINYYGINSKQDAIGQFKLALQKIQNLLQQKKNLISLIWGYHLIKAVLSNIPQSHLDNILRKYYSDIIIALQNHKHIYLERKKLIAWERAPDIQQQQGDLKWRNMAAVGIFAVLIGYWLRVR